MRSNGLSLANFRKSACIATRPFALRIWQCSSLISTQRVRDCGIRSARPPWPALGSSQVMSSSAPAIASRIATSATPDGVG
ncbi:hypothetical protein D3C81_1902180 [compost metagenome]